MSFFFRIGSKTHRPSPSLVVNVPSGWLRPRTSACKAKIPGSGGTTAPAPGEQPEPELLQVLGADDLVFNLKRRFSLFEASSGQVRTLSLRKIGNVTAHPVYFKVYATRVEGYLVRPGKGVILGGYTRDIDIQLYRETQEPFSDQFLVKSAAVPEDKVDKDMFLDGGGGQEGLTRAEWSALEQTPGNVAYQRLTVVHKED